MVVGAVGVVEEGCMGGGGGCLEGDTTPLPFSSSSPLQPLCTPVCMLW